MDLKQQIDELNKVIETHEANIETFKEKLKEAKSKHKAFTKLLVAAEALEEQKPERK